MSASESAPAPRRNSLDLEMAVTGLHMARGALLAFLSEHRIGTEFHQCDCYMCEDAAGILWAVRSHLDCLESQMNALPPIVKHMCYTDRFFPDAELLAEIITAHKDAARDARDEDDEEGGVA